MGKGRFLEHTQLWTNTTKLSMDSYLWMTKIRTRGSYKYVD